MTAAAQKEDALAELQEQADAEGWEVCRTCMGSGKSPTGNDCWTCDGEGVVATNAKD